jgi:diacylglycerol kinase family enzyme
VQGEVWSSVPGPTDRTTGWGAAEDDSRPLEPVLTVLSRLGSHEMPWTGLAIGLWLTGDRRARRAAWRSLGGLAAAGAAATAAGRGLAACARPDAGALSRPPPQANQTALLPSGRAARGAAFATGVALEQPRLAAPAIVLAVAAGVSEAVIGGRRPVGVLTGFALGAATGAATLRWWPRRPPVPAAAVRPPRQAPAAPAGEGLVLAVNASAGTASPRLARWLQAELPQAVIIETHAGQDLAGRLRLTAANARILGVAGGDGTVSTASSVALETGLPLLVIPAGTFNHFAGDLGIWSAEDALAALRADQAILVDVGVAGQRSFINTSSTGAYVDLVRARQQLENALGRRLAVIVALIRVLRRARPHELILNGDPRRLWLYFAGNCRYEPPGTAPAYRPALDDGYLDIRVVDAGPLARSRLIAAVITGALDRCRVYHAWQARTADISSAAGGPIWLSVDGEVATAESRFRQGKCPHGLLVYRNAASPAGAMPPAVPRWLRVINPRRKPAKAVSSGDPPGGREEDHDGNDLSCRLR